ncbi:hypothetical protein MCOR02_003020 [Pyricularia oryzae]|uniref:Uncharacterized protein n=5 Tax=Pyricularia TaxID=48558 RepID=A0ABQ8NT31_PYRGI|nr:uncharacterized protein MGG_15840 [Pyricularia oryzae 70-15]ELQ37224.1 hypothetical protein OOU_Y34scaffold00610g61 [Pyricularia oryzae Y34]KAH8839608.1 hypothetical protein MCOR01_008799 [Pyricularia oryzae]KAI6301783.1 hypothetical protein MCOR33_002767 [Pyricularia grisea]EHA55407.1 hypothetical protein MGG_15840 [Pyricularia oryzae 70-15]KAH9439466.1 hypothetical protein MCOR02_003020 [Pyricularia oryzae]
MSGTVNEPIHRQIKSHLRHLLTTRQQGSGSHSRSPKIKLALCQSFKWVAQPREARTCADIRLLLTDDQGGWLVSVPNVHTTSLVCRGDQIAARTSDFPQTYNYDR